MNVALIPVRGGSKSIPLKNIKDIAGMPLVYWTAKAASECEDIDLVYVATDSVIIRRTVEKFDLNKVVVINRSENTATDSATTESVMMEFACRYNFDNIVLIQATSPLLTSDDLKGGFEIFRERDTDSVLSVVRQKRFQWDIDKKGFAYPINYDMFCRPRRQEFQGYLVENGAFYITKRESFLKTKCRISGNIRTYEMDEDTYFEIDEPGDWLIIEKQLENRMKSHIRSIPDIKMFLTDCDGCLTDGGMYYSEKGDELKKFNAIDGMGFQLLREKGVLTGIVTGEQQQLNRLRAQKLKLDIYEEGINNKFDIVKNLCQKFNIQIKNVAYIGDDINDLELIKNVGFGCCVANGIESVKKAAKYVTRKQGGQGAVREVVDIILDNLMK